MDHCNSVRAQAACGAAPNNCDTIWRQYVELCHRVRSMDTSSGAARMTSTRNKYRFCLPGRFNMAGYANHKLYYVYKRYVLLYLFILCCGAQSNILILHLLYCRHTRGCSELLDELDAYANKSIVPGYLEYIGPGGAAHSSFRIPGTSHMYRCLSSVSSV